jgi:hypothetical protein
MPLLQHRSWPADELLHGGLAPWVLLNHRITPASNPATTTLWTLASPQE